MTMRSGSISYFFGSFRRYDEAGRGRYPHRDGGVEVRRIFHKLRSLAIEPFNGLFKNIFEWRGQMPVKGLKRCQLFARGAILLYQIVLLYQHQRQQPVGVGIKALLRAA